MQSVPLRARVSSNKYSTIGFVEPIENMLHHRSRAPMALRSQSRPAARRSRKDGTEAPPAPPAGFPSRATKDINAGRSSVTALEPPHTV